MIAVVGVVGEKRAGKDTLVDVFRYSVSNVSVVTFSDILFETLALWELSLHEIIFNNFRSRWIIPLVRGV